MNEKEELTRIERERNLLFLIAERDQKRIRTLENRSRKVLYVGYFTGVVLGLG